MKKAIIGSNKNSISEEHLLELQKIGSIIRELRFNFGLLTQKELAEKSVVHFNTIQAIEHGERNYNILSLLKVISFFDYELSTFFKDFI